MRPSCSSHCSQGWGHWKYGSQVVISSSEYISKSCSIVPKARHETISDVAGSRSKIFMNIRASSPPRYLRLLSLRPGDNLRTILVRPLAGFCAVKQAVEICGSVHDKGFRTTNLFTLPADCHGCRQSPSSLCWPRANPDYLPAQRILGLPIIDPCISFRGKVYTLSDNPQSLFSSFRGQKNRESGVLKYNSLFYRSSTGKKLAISSLIFNISTPWP